MFTVFEIFYYILFALALLVSFWATNQSICGLNYLRLLLIGGLISEVLVDATSAFSFNSNLIYYIYLPFEYLMLTLFFAKSVKMNSSQRIIVFSIPVYLMIYVALLFYYYPKFEYPGMIYNLGCLIIIIWAVIRLFNLEIVDEVSIVKNPLFWICTGLLILYTGVFFYNAVYNYLLHAKSELASSLRLIINMNLNYLFYLAWIYAFICSIRLKKYSIQL